MSRLNIDPNNWGRKIGKGLENPDKILPFFKNNLYEVYHKYHLQRGSQLYQVDNFQEYPSKRSQSFFEIFFPRLNPSRFWKSSIPNYLQVYDFAQYNGCRSVLEIGSSGYSTLLWAKYAKQTKAKSIAIDHKFHRIESEICGTGYEEIIKNNVDLKHGLSIKPADIARFYAEPIQDLSGVGIEQFKSELDRFVRARGSSIEILQTIHNIAPKRNWDASDILMSEKGLQFPEEYLEIKLKGEGGIDERVADMMAVENTGILYELLDENHQFDLVWFDSGQACSMIEWSILKNHLPSGAIAAFHDIFFPKQMKNFVICASILSDSNWEVQFVDHTTPEGVLIAKKI